MKSQEFTIPQQFMVGDIKINTKALLDRTYLRLLIDAFIPCQEAMLANLDELVAKHAPQRIEEQLKEVEKHERKKHKEWEQTHLPLLQADEAEQLTILGRLHDIDDEERALHQTHMELLQQLDLVTRSQSILQDKREDILKLLQRRQDMIEEGTWEKIGGKDNMSHLFSLMGDDSYGFGFSKLSLQASPINDIFDWMTQNHPNLLPPGDPFPPSSAPSQAAVAEKKEPPSPLQTEFPHVPDEVTANIRTFLAIQRPAYTLHSLLDRSDSEKRAWLALLSRKLHDETIEQVSDVIIELKPSRYMSVQNVQEPLSTQQSPVPDTPS